MMIEAGMDPAEFKGTGMEVRVAVQKAKRERAKRLGLDHYDKFTDGQLTDSWATGYFPNVQIGMHPEVCSSCGSSRTRPTRSGSTTTT